MVRVVSGVTVQKEKTMAKLKAAVTGNDILNPLVAVLNGKEFCMKLMDRVLNRYFHVDDPAQRPAEYYVQFTDRTVEIVDGMYGVEVRLTGVSVTPARTDGDFHTALLATVDAYSLAIKQNVPQDVKVQLFVAIMVDGVVRNQAGVHVSVIESDPVWVTGKMG